LKLVFQIYIYIYMESFESFHFDQWVKSYEKFLFAGIYRFSTQINFEVFYFTQFSNFLKKIKIIGFRLFITTLQLLELAFFNSIIKFLKILYFEPFSISFYLQFFPICCTIPNDLNFFKYVANLPWRMNPKKHHHFGHFFI